MSILVPFDFNPISTTVKTGMFTVPAGKYGWIKPLGPQKQDLTIDTVIAFPQNYFEDIILVSAAGTFEGAFLPGDGLWKVDTRFELVSGAGTPTLTSIIFQPTGGAPGTADFSMDFTTEFNSATPADNGIRRFVFDGHSSSFIRLIVASFAASSLNWITVAQKLDADAPVEMKVTTGAVLDGTRYVFEEFNVIS